MIPTSHTGGYHTVIYISITVNILSTTAVLIPNHNYVLKIDEKNVIVIHCNFLAKNKQSATQ